ncbi:putative iGluR-like protein [Homarus americanus]|uniref:Putative iGluR-like protein n=1 Tax=Homarus americanus TaxID=6706 RepID=A0A8J5NDM0_HOMAM|nr:putative iGluR-like protein [Homarus americanus]
MDMATGRANAPAVLADRGRIIGLWQGGMAPADVADAMDVSTCKKTVLRWITRWQEEGSLTAGPGSGKPRVTTQDDDARLLAAVDNTPKKTVIDLTRELMLPCHPQTNATSCVISQLAPLRMVLINPYPNSQ